MKNNGITVVLKTMNTVSIKSKQIRMNGVIQMQFKMWSTQFTAESKASSLRSQSSPVLSFYLFNSSSFLNYSSYFLMIWLILNVIREPYPIKNGHIMVNEVMVNHAKCPDLDKPIMMYISDIRSAEDRNSRVKPRIMIGKILREFLVDLSYTSS